MTDFPIQQQTEHWRPLVHYTPQRNWMNDPNGMVYYQGKYHLFYQHNPYGNDWGNMQWGHASSTDLVSWQEHKIAIPADPDGLGYIFSGSAVVDWRNTSGLQCGEHPVLVAAFTHHSKQNIQSQSIAFSQDAGATWHTYANNPVIVNAGDKDFRDPKLIWHEQSGYWVMALACGQCIKIYRSKNLLKWQFCSEFGEGLGAHTGEWECPDLFPMTDCNGEEKWILLVSMNPGGPNSGSAIQYFVGEFDGVVFKSDHHTVKWLDYGPDHYAGVTWDGRQNIDDRRILVGWMSNWSYAGELPTFPWRGAMTIPRELSLIKVNGDYRIASAPAQEIKAAIEEEQTHESSGRMVCNLDTDSAIFLDLSGKQSLRTNLSAKFSNDNGEELNFTYYREYKKIVLDRRKAGWDFKLWTMPLIEAEVFEDVEEFELQIVLDKSSIEIFSHSGVSNITANVFPSSPFNKFEILAESIALTIGKLGGRND